MSEARAAFAHRLNEAFDRLGIPAKQHGRFTALSRLFGVSAVAARDWCEGKSYPSVDKLLVILDTVRCGADWLLYGRTAPGAGERPGVTARQATAQQSGAAGPPGPQAPPGAAGPPPAGPFRPDGTEVPPVVAAGAAESWQRVDSDCMAPTLYPGDQVRTVPVAESWPVDGIYLVQAASGPQGGGLRRLQRQLDGSLGISCDNPLYGERGQFLPGPPGRLASLVNGGAEIRLLGKVVEVRRALP